MTTKIIGLTGGIASGKSTVSHYLNQQYNLPVFDADILAREAVVIDSPILKSIIHRYGEEILQSDKSLNRSKLGEIVFNNHEEKEWLESQIHPFVYQKFNSIKKETQKNIIVFVIPLLFEAKMTDLITESWVINSSYEKQLQRLQERNNLSVEEAKIRINSQMPLEKKILLADVVINNNGDKQELYKQIDQVFNHFYHT